MIQMEQLQAGIVKFIDRDIAPGLSGWDRVIIAGGCGLLTANMPNIIAGYADNPVVSALGVYDKSNGTIDIDALYQVAKQYMGADPLPVKVPLLGVTMKIGKREIDALYSYIKEGVSP